MSFLQHKYDIEDCWLDAKVKWDDTKSMEFYNVYITAFINNLEILQKNEQEIEEKLEELSNKLAKFE